MGIAGMLYLTVYTSYFIGWDKVDKFAELLLATALKLTGGPEVEDDQIVEYMDNALNALCRGGFSCHTLDSE